MEGWSQAVPFYVAEYESVPGGSENALAGRNGGETRELRRGGVTQKRERGCGEAGKEGMNG